MADVISGLWVCADCLMFHANGPDDLDAETVEAIVAGCEREAPYQWVCDGPHTGEHAPTCRNCDGLVGRDEEGDLCVYCHGVGKVDEDEGADTQEFSWSECDCCGSTLGGSRHRMALIKHD